MKTIEDLDVRGRRVLVRVDFNVPLQDGAFADQLAALADAYVGDGFAAVHRRHASVTDVPARLPHAAGYLLQAEVEALTRLTTRAEQPYVLVLGGAKVPDKLGVIGNLLRAVDTVIVGGAMVFPFLVALGYSAGRSPAAPEDVKIARRYLLEAAATGTELVLPVDLMVAPEASADAPRRVVAHDLPPGLLALDIGPESVKLFEAKLAGARTIFWNGPMGVFEIEQFSSGTREIARAIAASGAYTVVGGGDTAAAIRGLGFTDDQFGHVSTGGGASLEYLEGRTLPGLAALERD